MSFQYDVNEQFEHFQITLIKSMWSCSKIYFFNHEAYPNKAISHGEKHLRLHFRKNHFC